MFDSDLRFAAYLKIVLYVWGFPFKEKRNHAVEGNQFLCWLLLCFEICMSWTISWDKTLKYSLMLECYESMLFFFSTWWEVSLMSCDPLFASWHYSEATLLVAYLLFICITQMCVHIYIYLLLNKGNLKKKTACLQKCKGWFLLRYCLFK